MTNRHYLTLSEIKPGMEIFWRETDEYDSILRSAKVIAIQDGIIYLQDTAAKLFRHNYFHIELPDGKDEDENYCLASTLASKPERLPDAGEAIKPEPSRLEIAAMLLGKIDYGYLIDKDNREEVVSNILAMADTLIAIERMGRDE